MVLLTPVFCVLGFWQLDRAEQKRNIANTLEMRRKMPALYISYQLPENEQLEFRRVSAKGRFVHNKTILIENRKHQGKQGFHVVTPLQLTGSDQIVLVNRGWIPRQGTDHTPSIPSPECNLTIEGEVNIPQPPALALDLRLEPTAVLPQWPFLTLENYRTWSGLEILPFMILQSADKSSAFVRQWPRPPANDAMHIGYAIQWFAFALITLLIWLRLSLHKKSPGEPR